MAESVTSDFSSSITAHSCQGREWNLPHWKRLARGVLSNLHFWSRWKLDNTTGRARSPNCKMCIVRLKIETEVRRYKISSKEFKPMNFFVRLGCSHAYVLSDLWRYQQHSALRFNKVTFTNLHSFKAGTNWPQTATRRTNILLDRNFFLTTGWI